MKTLTEIFNEIGHFGSDIGCNDKGSNHSYTEVYDRLLKPYQKHCHIMEIGLALGDSIKLFDEYFNQCSITGIDITLMFPPKEYKNNVTLIEADATKADILKVIPNINYDVIIDDASHMESDQVATFNILKEKMNAGGIYIIEDILNLEMSKDNFLSLHNNCEIIDLRDKKGRFDDVLIVYRF